MDRRWIVAAGSSFAIAGAGASRPVLAQNSRRKGDERRRHRTFVFIHGAWHSAVHFERVTALMSLLGHRTFAIDLPGSGLNAAYPSSYLRNDFAQFTTEVSPLKGLTLTDYVNYMVPYISFLAELGPVTLVGHSFGGLSLNLIAERIPERISRLVYLTAYCPVRLPSILDYSALPENASSLSATAFLGDPAQTGAIRINPRSSDPAYLEKCRMAFYTDVPLSEFDAFAVYLNPDLSLAAAQQDARGTPDQWGSVPRTYIRCTLDRANPIEVQDLMIREADYATPGNRFDQRTLVSSHSPFASMPKALAELLVALD